MHVAEMRFKGFKRFTDTTITGLPSDVRLVVLAGPNGVGKSSVFDGFRTWQLARGVFSPTGWDESYGAKVGAPELSWPSRVELSFHEGEPVDEVTRQRCVYIRTAFRNEADFNVTTFSRLASPLASPRVGRLVDADMSVSENYQRMVMLTIDSVFGNDLPDTTSKGELRDKLIGEVATALLKVFPDLELTGVGAVGSGTEQQGSFYFQKGAAQGFLYKNLSAGEKAAFDLLLDIVVKREYYTDTVWCIDEPEVHLNTRVQAKLLEAILGLLPEGCQLWLASHSIGFMKAAWDLAQADPESVSFVDMDGQDFDEPVAISPKPVNRAFWAATLDVALGDLASLIAPQRIVLCEGRPQSLNQDANAEFDAKCYRTIFAGAHPDVDFLSVGNALDASEDRLGVGLAIQTIVSGTAVTRLRDRDDLNDDEVGDFHRRDIRVLSRRHIESYLLDDEVLTRLCEECGALDAVDDVIAIKAQVIEEAVGRGVDRNNLKKMAGGIYVGVRKRLNILNGGSNWAAFASARLAPLITPGLQTYHELEHDIFGA